MVAAAAPGLAAGYLEFGKVQICQALVVGQRSFDGSVLQGTGFHVSGLLVSAIESLGRKKKHTLVCSIGAPKLSSIKVSPVNGSEGSRGEDGISAGVV